MSELGFRVVFEQELKRAIPAEFATKLDRRLSSKLECDRAERDRRVAATIDFLRCCGADDAPMLAPCEKVDEVWHEMIMFTADYRGLCRNLGIEFIDHEPIEDGAVDPPSVAQTVSFMRDHGLFRKYSADLWLSHHGTAKCCGGHRAN